MTTWLAMSAFLHFFAVWGLWWQHRTIKSAEQREDARILELYAVMEERDALRYAANVTKVTP